MCAGIFNGIGNYKLLCVSPCVYPVHTLYARETREDRDIKETTLCHPIHYIEVFVGVLESHRAFIERVFDIEDMGVVREIIIKKSASSNNYIFFSVIHLCKHLILARNSDAIVDDERLFFIRRDISDEPIYGEIIREYDRHTLFFVIDIVPNQRRNGSFLSVMDERYLFRSFLLRRFPHLKSLEVFLLQIFHESFGQEQRENLMCMHEIVRRERKNHRHLIRGEQRNGAEKRPDRFQILRSLRRVHPRNDRHIESTPKRNLHERSHPHRLREIVLHEVCQSLVVNRPTKRDNFYKHKEFFYEK